MSHVLSTLLLRGGRLRRNTTACFKSAFPSRCGKVAAGAWFLFWVGSTWTATFYSRRDGVRRYRDTTGDLLRSGGEALVVLAFVAAVLAGSVAGGVAIAARPALTQRIGRMFGLGGMPRSLPWLYAQVRAAAAGGMRLETYRTCDRAVEAYREDRGDAWGVAWLTAVRLRHMDQVVDRCGAAVAAYRRTRLDADLAARATLRGGVERPGFVLAVCRGATHDPSQVDPFLDRYTLRGGAGLWWRLIHAPAWLYDDYLTAHDGGVAGVVSAAACDAEVAHRAAVLWQDEPTMPLHDPHRCIAAARLLERGRSARRA